MSNIPIALQLYSIREDCACDFSGTLEAVANMGYEGVEFHEYYGLSPDEVSRILDKVGLKATGAHIRIDALREGKLEETIEFHKILGNTFLIVPGFPKEMTKSKAAWLETAQFMNRVADRVRDEGLRVGYHNHQSAKVFQPMEGELPWDLFFGTTKPDVVMQLDVGNAMCEGISADEVLESLKRYPGRATTVHLKEFSSTNEKALLGEGEMKWQEFFSLCETIGGTEWYIVEQEYCPFSPLESVRKDLNKIKNLMKK